MLFPMQIYTNFESNSQHSISFVLILSCCFRCKFTQILKAIHNDENYIDEKGQLFPMQIYTNFESNSQLAATTTRLSTSCFRCKFTQILKAIHMMLG